MLSGVIMTESDSSDHMEYAYEDDDDEDEEGLMVLDAQVCRKRVLLRLMTLLCCVQTNHQVLVCVLQRSYSRRPSSAGFSSRTGSSSSNSGDDEEVGVHLCPGLNMSALIT